ncbi:hypothetical protein P3W53_26085 [Pseudomonas denitrificans (nom. rej.)]|nr:hypothetical protein [Pseudomonas denitrificans (nom. rej.)]
MFPENKEASLIIKLNRLTSLKTIEWRAEDVPHYIVSGTENIVPIFMSTEYKGQTFGLYQCRYPWFDGDRDRFFWSEKIVLCILNRAAGIVVWENSEDSSVLNDLFSTARHQVANIDGILDDLLSDDDDFI